MSFFLEFSSGQQGNARDVGGNCGDKCVDHTPAQSSDCPAFSREPLCHAGFTRPQGWRALGHKTTNVFIARRFS